jgi:hypothetical protein
MLRTRVMESGCAVLAGKGDELPNGGHLKKAFLDM